MSESQDDCCLRTTTRLLAVLTTALNQLAEICPQVDAGLALGLAGLHELRDVTDDDAALAAYRQIMTLLKADLERRRPVALAGCRLVAGPFGPEPTGWG